MQRLLSSFNPEFPFGRRSERSEHRFPQATRRCVKYQSVNHHSLRIADILSYIGAAAMPICDEHNSERVRRQPALAAEHSKWRPVGHGRVTTYATFAAPTAARLDLCRPRVTRPE
jgi:hypothetical protein